MNNKPSVILTTWNDTAVNYPRDRVIHQLFEAQAERTPDATAYIFDNGPLTYRDLNERANCLAQESPDNLDRLARGYHNLPELTRGKFIASKLTIVPGSRTALPRLASPPRMAGPPTPPTPGVPISWPQMSCIWEVWEQMGQRLPDAILCAVGQGSLLLGIWYGCQVLQQAGLLTAMPRLYAVQTTAYVPVVRA